MNGDNVAVDTLDPELRLQRNSAMWLEFRHRYLYEGNATKVAKDLGLDTRAGRTCAKNLSEDPEFQEERRALRKRALDELVAMRMEVARKAMERFESDTVDLGGGDIEDAKANVTVIDKRPDYGKLVIEAERSAHHLAKMDAGEKAGQDRPTRIELVLTDGGKYEAKPADDDTDDE